MDRRQLDILSSTTGAGVKFLNEFSTLTMHTNNSNERQYYMEEMRRLQDIIDNLLDTIDVLLRRRNCTLQNIG